MAERDWREEYEKLYGTLNEVSNLIAALQVVTWKLCQVSLERNPELDDLRDAIVGIGDGLERLVRKPD